MFFLALTFCLYAGAAQGAEITVSGAASLTDAFTEIKAAFEKANPGVKVNTNFAASNPLLQQIRQGAPADVFASADQETMDKAEEYKLIDKSTRRNFAANSLVLIAPKGNGKVRNVGDLEKAARIAVGNPDSVPAGRYARDSLRSVNKWDQLQPKYVFGESVRQVLDYVARGEVDAGFVYATDALKDKDKVDIVGAMTGHKPVLYPAAVISSSRDKESAKAFVDFLTGVTGMEILAGHGFSPAE